MFLVVVRFLLNRLREYTRACNYVVFYYHDSLFLDFVFKVATLTCNINLQHFSFSKIKSANKNIIDQTKCTLFQHTLNSV